MNEGPESETTVELWTVRIPFLLGLAEHHWFVIRRAGQLDRWEVWQSPDVGGESWGHLHRNLMSPEAGMGRSRARRLQHWTGAAARELVARITGSPSDYPACARYLVWPGPNSNTWVQWVLQATHDLGWRGWGRRYSRRLRGPRPALPQHPEPTPFEAAVFRWIGERNASVAPALAAARIVRRTHTGVGMYVDLMPGSANGGPVEGPYVEAPLIDLGAGCLLWLTDGKPGCLEVSAYGASFPANVEDFILPQSANPPGS